jgi:hypothetical protein
VAPKGKRRKKIIVEQIRFLTHEVRFGIDEITIGKA